MRKGAEVGRFERPRDPRVSEPIGHALEAVAVEPKGDDPADNGHANSDSPIQSGRHVSEQWCPDNGDEAIKWIPVEQRASYAVGHDFGAPNDWCDVEQHLHRVGDDLRDIAEASAHYRDNHHHPEQVEDEQHQPWNGEQGHG